MIFDSLILATVISLTSQLKFDSFEVDRSIWLCGQKSLFCENREEDEYLAKRSCLCFYVLNQGVEIFKVTGEKSFFNLPLDVTDKLPKKVYDIDVRRAFRAVELANDDSGLSNEEREHVITAIFKNIGIAVKFVGEYPKNP